MDPSHAQLLRCPDDRSQFDLEPLELEAGGAIRRGTLRCRGCHHPFPIREGIASLLPRELRPASSEQATTPAAEDSGRAGAMLREIEKWDEQSPYYDLHYDDRSCRFELETYVAQLAPRQGERVLDVGCGTGRVTKVYLDLVDLVVGADYSFESLAFFRARLDERQRRRTLLVHCAVGRLPFADSTFDAAVATSLFSNLSTPELRREGLSEVGRVLVPQGRLLVTVYNHSLMKRVRQQLGLAQSGKKHGHHSGGRIPYYNFVPAEFSAWVAERLEPGPCFGLNHRVPILSRLSPDVMAGLDRLLSRTPLSLALFAKEMGLVARKRAAAPPVKSV